MENEPPRHRVHRGDLMMKRPGAVALIASPVVLVGVVMLVAFLFRLRGVTWGLPYLYDPDEHVLVDPAVRFVTTGDLNPHWFGYPGSTIMYPLGLAYLVYWIIGYLVGWFPDLQSFATLFWANPTSFYLIARIMTIVLATLAIPLTYALCRKMAGIGTSLAAAIFVAVSPLHADFSRVVRTDPVMTTFVLAAMFCAVKAMEEESDKEFFLSGIFVGLATATKWTGVCAAVTTLLAIAFASPEPAESKARRWRWSSLAALGGIIGFLGAAPFVFTGVRQVYWGLVAEGTGSHLSGNGSPGLSNWVWYITVPLRDAVGAPLELAALVGLVASLGARRRPRMLLAVFSILFVVGIGLGHKRWDRWIVPLMPCVAILAAIGLQTLAQAVHWWKERPRVRECVVVALGVLLVMPSAMEAFQRGGTILDTRDIGKSWIDGHVPPGSRVAVEQYAPPISRDTYQVFFVVEGSPSLQRDTTTRGFKGVLADMKTLAPLRGAGVDYVVTTNWPDRYRAEATEYPDEVRYYDELFAASDLLYEVDPTERTKGPVIRILKFRH